MKFNLKKLFSSADQKTSNSEKKQIESLNSLYFNNTETDKLYDMYTREFSELTTENLRFYFLSARKGVNYFKAFLFDEIRRRDLRIGGICESRKLSVLSNEWDIEGDDKEKVQFIKDNFGRINIQQMMSDIIEAQLQGMSIFQLFYEIENNKMYLSEAPMIQNYLVYSKGGIKFLDFSHLSIFSLRAQASAPVPTVPLIELDPMYYFEVYSFDGNEENGLLNGLIDSIIYGFFFKVYGLKDWSSFIERFAVPALLGTYDPLMSKSDREALWNAINNFGNLFRAMIPNTADLKPLSDNTKSQTGGSGGVFETYTDYWDNSLSIRVLGEPMTTDTSSGGSYAKAKVGREVSEDKKLADRILIKATFDKLIKKLTDLNYANVKQYPEFVFRDEEDVDLKDKKADVLVKLFQAGFTADDKEVSEMFDMVLTKIASGNNSQFVEKFAELIDSKKKLKVIDEWIAELWNEAENK